MPCISLLGDMGLCSRPVASRPISTKHPAKEVLCRFSAPCFDASMAMWMLCRAARGFLQSFHYREKDVTPLLQTKVAIRALMAHSRTC